jgi:pyruvate,water dikinase
MIRNYIEKMEKGEEVRRDVEKIKADRDRIVEEYRSLIQDEEDREQFDQILALAQNLFPYTENHIFYVEHFFHTVFWRKMREYGRLLHKHSYVKDPEDIWFLKRGELDDVIYELAIEWANRAPAHAPGYIPKLIEKRKEIYEKLSEWTPPPALGEPPEVITEPFTIMLWGVTDETIKSWLKQIGGEELEQTKELEGFPASPGVVEGRARVMTDIRQLKELEEGEILVCKATSPSWAPVFGKIKATVSDLGGIMCHAAIVSREYGLPAVVGTGYATQMIKSGDIIRVDGDSGKVTILN